jgi:hypothetical protein
VEITHVPDSLKDKEETEIGFEELNTSKMSARAGRWSLQRGTITLPDF